jgi:hypothetical protein
MSRDAAAEGFARQETSCREVANSMVAAVEKGAPARALSLFEPGLLIQVGHCTLLPAKESLWERSSLPVLQSLYCKARSALSHSSGILEGW